MISIRAYSDDDVIMSDPQNIMARAQDIRFSTVYPGGYYESLSFFVPCDPTKYLPFTWRSIFQVYDGLTLIWDGYITSMALVQTDDRMGVEISAAGRLARFSTMSGSRRWIDRRFSADMKGVWEYQTSTLSEKCTPDQYNRLMFTPKAVAWASGDYVAFRYSRKQSAYLRRIKYSYDLQEAAQAWEISLWRSENNGSSFTQITGATGETWTTGSTSVIASSGTGSIDVTFAVDVTDLEFRFYSRAAQTPAADGTQYAKITNMAVFCENDAGNAVTTVSDIVKAYVALAVDYSDTYIATNSYDLTNIGFVADDLNEYYTDTINRVIKFSSTNAAYSFGFNEYIQPYLEQVPALTDYDYSVRLGDPELSGVELVLAANYGELANSIFVRYRDETGKTNIVTSLDDVGLAYYDSQVKYRTRKYHADAGTSSSAGAIDYGKQVLNSKKDLIYYMRAPLQLTGTIKAKNGSRVPVAHVRAGKRIKIENFSTDVGDTLGGGLTFLISRTEYDDANGVLSVTAGVPDDLAVYLARKAVMDDRLV